jgi:hypothetical protein
LPQQVLKVAEALRVAGLDELKFTNMFRRLIYRISKPNQSAKLLLDAIKEWGRHLAPAGTSDRAASDAPVPIQLIHNVPRPDRSEHAENATDSHDFADAPSDISGA